MVTVPAMSRSVRAGEVDWQPLADPDLAPVQACRAVGDDPEPAAYVAGGHENIDWDVVGARRGDSPHERRRLVAEQGFGTDG